MRRGFVGVRYGRPAPLLDAAGFAEEAWIESLRKLLDMSLLKLT